jgi:hypothetical protein
LLVKVFGLLKSGLWLDQISTFFLLKDVLVAQLVLVNLLDILITNPVDPLPILPDPVLDLVLREDKVRAQAMLLALGPPALVPPPVLPKINAKTFLFVIGVLTDVDPAVCPEIEAESVHVILLPLPEIATAVFPLINPHIVDFIVQPLALVGGPICPNVLSKALFLSVYVVSLVLRVV